MSTISRRTLPSVVGVDWGIEEGSGGDPAGVCRLSRSSSDKGGGGVPGKEKGMYEGSEAGKSSILQEVKGGPNDGNSVGKGQESRWGLCGSLTWEGEGP